VPLYRNFIGVLDNKVKILETDVFVKFAVVELIIFDVNVLEFVMSVEIIFVVCNAPVLIILPFIV
jgi:hypothetical protein